MMFQAFDKILQLDTSDHQKVEILRRAVSLLKRFEDWAEDRKGRGSAVDLLQEFARKNGIDARAVTDSDVKVSIERGIAWLVTAQRPGGGWGWLQQGRVRPKTWGTVKGAARRALPWDTAVTLSALQDWYVHSTDKMSVAALLESVKKGATWLLEVQGADGGWNELGEPKAPGYALATGVALWALRRDGFGLSSASVLSAVRRALEFFDTLQNRDGGAGAEPGTESDTKATALSLMCHVVHSRDGKQLTSRGQKVVEQNMRWLLHNQGPDGNWGGIQKGQFIDPAFYATSALQLYASVDGTAKSTTTVGRTIEWYVDQIRYVDVKDAAGWAWGDVPNTAAAVAALLNNGIASASPSVQKGVEWLLRAKGADCWKADTALAVIALTRYLKPGSRLSERLSAERL